MSRIGIYGGTFNPPHTGHMLAVREFAEKLGLDRVLMIPDRIPPHKPMAPGSPDAQIRLHLCRLAAQDLDYVTVSDLELRREGRSYTADTVRELKAKYPEDELILLMGTDMFLTFHQWWKPEEIVRYVSLAMANRTDPSEEEQAAIAAQKRWLEEELGAKAEIVENDRIEISSTAVRALLLFGAGRDVLPEPVYEEICRLGLYRTGISFRRLTEQQLWDVSVSLHKAGRIPHVDGCRKLAVRLAERWGADPEGAARAAILHDCTKMLRPTEQLILCRRYGILLDDFDRQNESLLHAKTAAAVAAQVFGESEAVCGAVRWHTTGRAAMTLLEKILYLADMIEETRSYEGVEELRTLAETDLDAAVRLGLQRTIRFVRSGGRSLHPDSAAALRFMEESMLQSNDNNEVDK